MSKHKRGPVMRRQLVVLAFAATLTVGASACGSSNNNNGSGGKASSPASTGGASGGDVNKGKKGGVLTVLAQSDVDNFDPGLTYEQFSFEVFGDTNRSLYSYTPPKYDQPVPDLADGQPTISADNKTVTVKIKKGVKFSPPVNREVTSKDVAYGLTRTFTKNVPNGYVSAYFGSLLGVKDFQSGKAKKIAGIETPDNGTIVFKLDKPQAGVFSQALTLTASAPVPEEYAAKFDAKNPSTYAEHQVATGPYMIKNDASGKITGHTPGKELNLVRNPNWDAKTDFRPAYVDAINIREGITDATSGTRKILSGNATIEGNVVPPAEELRKLVTGSSKEQLAFAPGGGGRYVSMNTTIKPFDDINVRKAVIAGFDRNALRLSRGGPILGDVSTHQISPGIPGFEEAGGVKGFGFDWLAKPAGDPALSAKYFKAAGYKSGKYEGNEKILMVGENNGVPAKTAQVARAQFEKLGFKVNFKGVPHDIMYTKFCNVPKQQVAVCPNTGFFKDFNDPQTLLDLTFNGEQIVPVQNTNWPQLNVPAINKAIDKGREVVGSAARAKYWANVDRMITEQAPVIPWLWDNTPLTRSKDVVSIPSSFTSSWDFAYTYINK
ncbi:MAG: hypothetical protein JWN65_1233 [Solirubrobacterales bacterium]|nr:hypothetical protein [Solirubrobacterales bacterium]